MGRKPLGLFALSLILFFLSGPGKGTPFFVFLFLVPALFAFAVMPPVRAFWSGLVFFTVMYCAVNYWFLYSAALVFKLPVFFSFLLYILLGFFFYGLYHSFFALLFAAAWKRYREGRGVLLLLSSPLLWGGAEYLRGTIYPAFNITTLGSFLYRHPFFLQGVEYTGEFLLSIVIIYVNLFIFLAIHWFYLRRADTEMAKKALLPAAVSLTAVLSWIGLSLYAGYNYKERPLPSKKLVSIQAMISHEKKWKRKYYGEVLEAYGAVSRGYGGNDNTVIIWPETALNFYPTKEGPHSDRLKALTLNNGFSVIAGGPEVTGGPEGKQYFNAVYRIAGGRVESVYRKEKLIPFAEYCPVDFLYPLFQKVIGKNQFTSWGKNRNVSLGGITAGLAICFESTFPDLMKDRAKGADMVMVLSDDIWLGDTGGPRQHLAACVLRAIENRVWVLSAVNSGISALIGPEGRIRKEIPFGKKGEIEFQGGG